MNLQIPKVEFVTGPAGTGKTYLLKSRIKTRDSITNRYYGTLCATTGIAAVNLSGSNGDSVSTINSELKYFNTESLLQNYVEGKLQKSLLRVANKGANLCIDEVSMMEAKQLDIIYQALSEVNTLDSVRKNGGLGLVLSGDFCQLAPVEGDYAFMAQCWPNFASNTTKLTKIYRQENLEFLDAINAAREGDGGRCARLLGDLDNSSDNRIFSSNVDLRFEGTTILPLNKDVDRFNLVRLGEMLEKRNKKVIYKSCRWGKQDASWKNIPEELVVTENSYVMILSNNPPDFDYANGDCGWLECGNETLSRAMVRLKRNGEIVDVGPVCRRVYQKETPEGEKDPLWLDKGEWKGRYGSLNPDYDYDCYLKDLTRENKPKKGVGEGVYFDYEEKKWVMGEIIYTPIRLAYASTCHKTQGLTLDSVQIDPHNKFFGQGSMLYVALSRVRSHEGLRIVGDQRLVEERCNIVEDVMRWI